MILLQEAEWHFREVTEIAAEHFHIYQGADQLFMLCSSLGDVKIEGRSEQDSFGLETFDAQAHVQQGAQARRTHVHTPLCSPGQHDREEARNCKAASGSVQDVSTIGGDFNTSAFRKGGKVKLSSIEEVWEEMRLTHPPDLVPMWGQMEDSGDCCCFVFTNRSVTNWRAARHGSLQLNKRCK